MLWILLVLLTLWVGVGTYLSCRAARAAGSQYRRTVDRRVVAVGEELEVGLRLIPPNVEVETVDDRDVVLVIDRSASMGSGPASALADALEAARGFVLSCPGQIHIGIVAFDHTASLLGSIGPGTEAALGALERIETGGNTAIDRALDCTVEALEGGRPGVAKTVILLSDGGSAHRPAQQAARRLLEAAREVTLICVGIGQRVDRKLLTEIAGSEERFCHVSASEDLEELFFFFAASVSGRTARSAWVDEGARAPDPFLLRGTGQPHPVGVATRTTTRIVWAAPILDPRPLAFTYRLEARSLGWHPVAADDGVAQWRMPDGSERRDGGPPGPRVLVLPGFLTWAWPVLNPLFFLLFARFFRSTAASPREEVPAIEPLPVRSLPEPLPPVAETVYAPSVRPAVVIGLGEVGERVLCRIEDRLRDRDIDPKTVERWLLDVGDSSHRRRISYGAGQVDAEERIELRQDFRLYLEGLRRNGIAPTRSWIPWREWLADASALTTQGAVVADRRLARLALLLSPGEVEQSLLPPLGRVLEEDGIVVLVGAAEDFVTSGLLAEVAHICAGVGASATVLLTRGEDPGTSESVAALERELSRLVALRGDVVSSDRHDPPVVARQLFDRVVVMPGEGDPSASATRAAELLWSFLAYRTVFEQVPTARVEGGVVQCSRILIEAEHLPAGSLWRWLRERTLAREINGRFLGLHTTGSEWFRSTPDEEEVARRLEEFWSPSSTRRPQSPLASQVPALLGEENPAALLLGLLPSEAMRHELIEIHQRERRTFRACCEQWLTGTFDHEEGWGLPLAAAVLDGVLGDLLRVVELVAPLKSSQRFGAMARLAADLYTDHISAVRRLSAEMQRWITALAGPGGEPLCDQIEEARQRSQGSMHPPTALPTSELERRADEWADHYGRQMVEQLSFEVKLDHTGGPIEVNLWLGNQVLAEPQQLLVHLRAALDCYRGTVVSWLADSTVSPRQFSNPRDRVRLGARSADLFPQVTASLDEEDPYFNAALEIRQVPLEEALDVVAMRVSSLPFAWPEEANAARIADKIRHSELRREPRPFSPLAVHLLRDPVKLWSFFAALANNQVEVSSGTAFLERQGVRYRLAEVGDEGGAQAEMEFLEAMMRQAVALEISLDGDAIPASDFNWAVTAQQAVTKVEADPAVAAVLADPGWPMWRDVIRGVALDVLG